MSSDLHQSASLPPRQRPDRAGARRLTVNLPLLFATVVLVAIAAPALYFWYQHRAGAMAETFLARAVVLKQEGDHDGAVSYYQKLLLSKPDHEEGLLGLIDAYSQGERSQARLTRLNELIRRGLGRAPEQHDLRVTLAENLLDLKDYEAAKDEAKKLLEASPKHELVARKVSAIAKFALSQVDSSISRSEAIGEMLAVAEQLPGDVRLINETAAALRQHPDALPAGDDAAEKADQLMNRLIEKNPDDVDARLARCRYRLVYRLPEVEADLAKALELEPENVQALLLSAQAGLGEAGATLAAREKTLRRVIELAPDNPLGYLLLASHLSAEGKTAEAVELLKSGREMTHQHLDISLALADAQLDLEQFDDAKATIAEIERESVVLLPHMSLTDRDRTTNKLRVIQARYAASQQDTESAIAKLTSVITDSGSPDQVLSPEWVRAALILARLHTQAGRTDQANEYWDVLSLALPGNLSIATESVNSDLATGNPQQAIRRIEEFERIAEPSPELRVRRVQAHLALQLARSASEQNWTEFDKALEDAEAASPASRELVFAESQRLMATDNKPAAVARLRAAEELFADDATFWHIAAMAYQQLGEKDDVARALEKHKVASESIVDEAKLGALILVREQNFAAADELLSGLADSANEQEKQELLQLRVEVLRASGDLAAALTLIEPALEKGEPNERLLALGIDTALVLGKLESAQRWEEQLAKKTGNGFEARLSRARRLTISWEKLDTKQRQQLLKLVSELRAERPGWFPVVTLSASIAQLNGESRRALEEYERAIQLGNRQPSVVQQVVILLYEAGRFDEVERYMAMVAGDAANTPFFDMMAVEVAARQGQNEEALKLAKESVDLHPEDVERRLFLGSLLLGNDKATEAVEVFQQAAKDFSNDNRVWVALFNAYVRSDQVDFARKALGRLVTSTLLPVETRHFVAGQGYEIIGDLAQAIEQYKLAMAAAPSAVDVRLRYANLLSQQNPQEARAELQRALQFEPTNTIVQRQLAILLATSGNEEDWQDASRLLSAAGGTGTGDAASNDRLRAMLLSQQGRTREERVANCRLAREIIVPLLKRTGDANNDQNRRVMAGIFQREASLSGDTSLLLQARDELRKALDQGPLSAAELGSYIEFLLQSAKTLKQEEADGVGEVAPNDSDVADQIDTYLSEADSRIAELNRMQTTNDENLAALIVSLEARLQLAQDDKAGAEATINEFVESRQSLDGLQPRQIAQRCLLLGQLCGVIEDHAEAEQWYRRLMEQSPDAYLLVVEALIAQGKRAEAAQLGLEMAGPTPSPAVAKVLARIMTVTSDEIKVDPAVEEALAKAIESNEGDIELLQAEAVMRASRGDYAPAIATMRKILDLDPKHALTLNNLATLLAERPNQRAEALDLIARAIEVAGRNPMFLDTQGTIHLKLGDAKAAIASLEEATAGRATDARYYLHLAAAYKLGGRDDDARRMLIEARAFGLENFVLTEDDRNMLTSLEESLPSEGSVQQ